MNMYAPSACMPASPHPILTSMLYEEAARSGLKIHLGPVFSSDSFYAETPEFAKYWSERGVLAVEMECAAIFSLGWMRKLKTAAMLIISDSLVHPEEREPLTAEHLQSIVEKVAYVVLRVLSKFER